MRTVEIISRKEAKSLGLKRYYTGKPCSKGHSVERRTANGVCLACENTEEAKETARICSRRHYVKNRDKILLQHEVWRRKNKDYRKNHYEENRKKYCEMSSRRRIENISEYRARDRNRRSRKASAEGKHSKSDIDFLLKMQKGSCANCKCRFPDLHFHVYHINPLSRGGRNDLGNIQLLCPGCNLRKHAKDPVAWARENGRLI